ncbi:hypothetical protein cypCar_00009822, partial [Cyprinus carpio]
LALITREKDLTICSLLISLFLALSQILPTWLAPNLITLTGFMFLVLTFSLLSFYDFDFYASDGVDGKQARRTNSSTPLGELFDHGLDSWACVFFVATAYSVFGRGETGVSVVTLYYLLWVVLFSFILSHWEKYNTGILFLPWGYDISEVVINYRKIST